MLKAKTFAGCFVFCSLASVVLSSAPSAYAQKVVAPPFQIKALMKPNNVMAGEPVTVAFHFEGASDKRIVIFADRVFQWCTFEVVQKSTMVKSWTPNQRGQYLESIYLFGTNPSGRIDLSSGQEVSIVLPTEVLNLPVGNYKLRLTAKIPYKNNVEAKHQPIYSKGGSEAWEVIEIPFAVKPLDSEKMKSRVEKLYRSLGRETNLHTVRTMAYELGTLPPEFASRAWRTLLFDKTMPGIKRDAIAQMLSAQATREMADVLLEVQYTNPIRDDNGKILTLLNYLTRMYNNSDVGENPYSENKLHKYIRGKILGHRKSPFNTALIGDGPVM